MKAIVTGGAGFIGSHLTELLLDKGHEVIIIDNLVSGRLQNLGERLGTEKLSCVIGDIREPDGIKDWFAKDIDCVFHIAGIADIVPSIENPKDYFKTNVEGTINMLEMCRENGIKRFVYAASSSCYGIPKNYPTTEIDEIQPEYPYALSKYMGEQLVMHYHKVYDLPSISLRLFNVYGPRSRTSGAYGAVFGVFLAQKLNKEPLTIVGDGKQTRDFTYVTDVAEAFLAAAECQHVSGEIFNVGSGGTYSVNRIVELLKVPKTVTIPKRPGEPDMTFADIRKIQDQLHWKPTISIDKGVKKLLAHIGDYQGAPVWTPDSIALATEKWFKYLGSKGSQIQKILVTGGAGYAGSKLVPALLEKGYQVVVLDLYMYGRYVFKDYKMNRCLTELMDDIRDEEAVDNALDGVDAVIHLACISNDPGFDLNPEAGKTINLDSFEPLVKLCVKHKVKRFIYASSSSVYGIKSVRNVTEDMSLEPLTDYSKFKAECEEILLRYQSEDFTTVAVRPATLCGYAPRQRLDIIVNILTNHAYNTGKIKVTGGPQLRPNIHIDDMVRCYLMLLEAPKEKIAGEIFNVGEKNHSVSELAEIVKSVVEKKRPVTIETIPTNDPRSYHISSEKIADRLNFRPQLTIADAVQQLVDAFEEDKLLDSMDDKKYFNIEVMKECYLEYDK